MAERARMGVVTWLKIEKGEVGVALGAWLSALEQTGLLNRLEALTSPDADPVGEQLRKGQLRQRARRGSTAKDFDF